MNMSYPVEKVLVIIICTTILYSRHVSSMPSLQGEERLVNIQLLSEESNPDARVRREADSNLPDHLSFQVPLTQGEVTLRMKRSRLLPTATSHSGVDVAVYTDVDSGASLIVRRDGGEYSLQGSFLHENTQWHVKPVTARTRRQASDRQLHTVLPGRPNAETISFVGDSVEDKAPPVEIHSLEERNRYYRQRLATLQGETSTIDQRETKSISGQQPRNRTRSRTKRSATQHIVEIVFIADYADYQKWVAYKGAANAVNEMTLWYTYIAEEINIRYRTIEDSDIQIGTRVVHLKILTLDSDDDFLEAVVTSGSFGVDKGIEAFVNWYPNPSNSIPNADHYMLMTGFDIQGLTIGAAMIGRACTVNGVAICENDFSSTLGTVAAHELGHSFNMDHDLADEGCPETTHHVMTPYYHIPVTTPTRGNPWRFSSCSIAALKTYLNEVSCTEPQNTGTTDSDTLPAPTGDSRAGIALDRDDQCRQFFRSSSSSYCSGVQQRNGGESRLCGGMYCKDPDSPFCNVIMPLEFTTCGTGKWCRTGYCVDESEGPPNPPPVTSRPETIFDCVPYIFRNEFSGMLNCFRQVLFN